MCFHTTFSVPIKGESINEPMVKLMAELKTLVSVIVFKGFVFPFFLPDVNGLFYFLMK